MPSKALAISSLVSMGWRILRAATRLSASMAPNLPLRSPRRERHSGFHSARILALARLVWGGMDWRLFRAAHRLAASMAPNLPLKSPRRERHSGFHSARILAEVQVAKASLSQVSSHQARVTRSPNHWWDDTWLN